MLIDLYDNVLQVFFGRAGRQSFRRACIATPLHDYRSNIIEVDLRDRQKPIAAVFRMALDVEPQFKNLRGWNSPPASRVDAARGRLLMSYKDGRIIAHKLGRQHR